MKKTKRRYVSIKRATNPQAPPFSVGITAWCSRSMVAFDLVQQFRTRKEAEQFIQEAIKQGQYEYEIF